MNRYFKAAMVAAFMPLGLASLGCAHKSGSDCGAGANGRGGDHVRMGCYDSCWPDRYSYAARQSVVAPFAQQAATGHFLHQTLWNYYFEQGTDKLTPGGMEKLDSVARTTPSPDPRLYIQTARDVAVTPENMDKVVALRNDLNGKRAAAIKKYMTTQFGSGMEYEVYVHDAPVPGIYGPFAASAFRGQAQGYTGGLSAGSIGAGSVGGGGASGPAPNTGSTSVNVSQPAAGGGAGGSGASTPPTP